MFCLFFSAVQNNCLSFTLLLFKILVIFFAFQNRDESGKRDYLYYLAIGNARLKEYQTALKYIRGLLQVEPGNRQAQDLESVIKKKMEKEGLIGMAGKNYGTGIL